MSERRRSHRGTENFVDNWEDPRWKGIRRDYTPADVRRLCGSVRVEQTLARMGAERLWRLLKGEE